MTDRGGRGKLFTAIPGETRGVEPKMYGVFGRLCVSPFDRFRAMPNLSRTVGGKMAVR